VPARISSDGRSVAAPNGWTGKRQRGTGSHSSIRLARAAAGAMCPPRYGLLSSRNLEARMSVPLSIISRSLEDVVH